MFMYGGWNKKVKSAASNANLLMQNHAGFLKLIGEQSYTMTEVDGEDIASFMRDRYMNDIQCIKVRRTWNPWSAAVAWFKPKYPNNLYLNKRKLGRSVESITGSIIHEYVHLVDNFYTNASFGHGDNYGPKSYTPESPMWHEKYFSAPYWIGMMAKRFSEAHID